MHKFIKYTGLLFIIQNIFANTIGNPGISPETKTQNMPRSLVYSKHNMVVTNNPFASKVALQILKEDGNATDAAIAAAFVLGLTEPQSSGIGGGGYALIYRKANKQLIAYDGRETAPDSASSNWFLDKNNKPVSFQNAMFSAKSIGVPGEVALLFKIHQKNGKLPWQTLIKPAINLAENGFPMSPRLYYLLVADKSYLINDPVIKAIYFNKDSQVKSIGTIIKNPQYALSLRLIMNNPEVFYTGSIAKDIINKINQVAQKPLYSITDLAKYQVLTYNPVCAIYRNKYKICSIPPSSSGGVTLLELMQIYSANYTGTDYTDIKWVYNFLEASKLAFADRNQYIADPKFVKQPVTGLLNKDYINSRSKLVTKKALTTPVLAGIPKGADLNYTKDASPKNHGTTSIAIVDKNGNAVSMTVTVEHQFGSHIFVDGFFLNNELTDFSFIPVDDKGVPVANQVMAFKRPRSSIAPSMVFNRNGNLNIITGSPGGSAIICFVAKNLIELLDFKMDVTASIASPNLCNINGNSLIEDKTSFMSITPALTKYGEKVDSVDLVSGETTIMKAKNGGWYGAPDPRREGVALGN